MYNPIMKYDLTLRVTPVMAKDERKALYGHLGTHFDVMDKEFPLSYTELPGIVFDVEAVRDREITPEDIDTGKIREGMFVAFRTGFIEDKGYGTKEYTSLHPVLSYELLDLLLEKGVRIIGIDFAGVRRGSEHTPADQRAADHGTFIIENLCSLKPLIGKENLLFHTYPMNFSGMTGLPCRVVAETV